MKESSQIILVSCPDIEVAKQISRELVQLRLAACGQVFTSPHESTYWWNNQLESSLEYLVILKTREELWEAARDKIKSLHPFEVPEILSIPIQQSLPAYAAWLFNETKSDI